MFKDKYNRHPDMIDDPRGSYVNVSKNPYRYDGMTQDHFIRMFTPGASKQNSDLENHVAILLYLANEKGKTHICDQENDVDIPIYDEIKSLENSLGAESDQAEEIFYEVLKRIKNHIV